MKRNIYAVQFRPGLVVADEISDATAARLLVEGRSIFVASQGELSQLARQNSRVLTIVRGRAAGERPDAASPTVSQDRVVPAAESAPAIQRAERRCPEPALISLEVAGKIPQLVRRGPGVTRRIHLTTSPEGMIVQAYCNMDAGNSEARQQLLQIVADESSIPAARAC